MEFKQYRISDVAKLINGRAYLMPELQDSGKYKIVRVGNFSGKDEWFYSDMELEDDKYCYKGDLLFKWACTFGPEIWNEDKTIYHYHIWKIKTNEKYLDKEFFYYYLKYFTPYYLGSTNGTTMVHITKETMEKKKILIPESVDYQKKIAKILKNYDDSIKANLLEIKNIEDLIEKIYIKWFVNKDIPDYKINEQKRVKPKGWTIGSKSELEIPVSWKIDSLDTIGIFSRGKNITANEMIDGNIPVISAGLEPSGYHNESNVKGYSLTISASGANAGFLKYNLNDIWAADCSYYNDESNIWFMYSSLKFIEKALNNLQVGSAQPHVYPKNINKLNIIISESDIIEKYNNYVSCYFEKIKILLSMNDKLSETVNLLLPRLISGKIDVSNLEVV